MILICSKMLKKCLLQAFKSLLKLQHWFEIWYEHIIKKKSGLETFFENSKMLYKWHFSCSKFSKVIFYPFNNVEWNFLGAAAIFQTLHSKNEKKYCFFSTLRCLLRFLELKLTNVVLTNNLGRLYPLPNHFWFTHVKFQVNATIFEGATPKKVERIPCLQHFTVFFHTFWWHRVL